MKPAVLVIDVQNEYFAPHGKWVLPDGERALVQIQRLLGAARQEGIPVYHITHEALSSASPVFRPGSVNVEMYPEIEIGEGERRIVKHFPGSFRETPLEAYLRQDGVDTVVISGYMTQMCCDTTTRQARERGLDVLFSTDATAARDLSLNGEVVPHTRIHETTLAVMTQFASVLPTEKILAALARGSK